MISKIIFKKITFINLKKELFNKIIAKKGLFVFPSGPALSEIENSKNYYNSLKKADFAFFDSGLFVLLLRIFKKIDVDKFSGYKFLNYFFRYLKKNKRNSIFCIDPNLNFSKSNNKYLKNLGIKKIYNFIAPKYNSNNLSDKKLLKEIKRVKPNFIMTNIGGGTQEVLGLYLKKNLRFKTTILCTGGAISFFTGDQAPINNLIDKFYLGWLVRLIFNPLTFFKRYVIGLKLISIVIKSNVKVITDGKKIT
tara:strand:+ start:197 stop:946 length:750 start_codon:yes stop_codon:yes gene_type:complete